MNLESDHYRVRFDRERKTVVMSGTLRLQGRDEYREISNLLNESANVGNELTIDMRGLQFLNSSGISTLSLFVIEMRKQSLALKIVGSESISWQAKSLYNSFE